MSVIQRALFPVAKKFVAGESRHAVVERVAELNREGITPMVNYLGEHVTDKAVVERTVEQYDHLLSRFNTREHAAGLSVKPTQLGLDIDYEKCLENLQYLVRRAGYLDRRVWIDMESSAYTQDILDCYRELCGDHDNVGVTIQAYLKRSGQDVRDIVGCGGAIRLVKGTHDSDADETHSGEAVDDSYRSLLATLFDDAQYVAVATHDRELIDYARQLEERHNRARDSFEFQFLMGVRDRLMYELQDEGYQVSEYVPYGEDWLPYYHRRLAESKKNLLHAAKSFVHGH